MGFDGLLLVVIWADVEPDTPELNGRRRDRRRRALTWRGVIEGVPAVRTALGAYQDDDGGRPKVTWCLQADEDIALAAGRPDYIFAQFEELWDQVRAEGDEVGWHPHLLRFSTQEEAWVHEAEDLAWIREMMTWTWSEIKGYGVKSTRQGMDFADGFIINLLEELGLEVDGTAQPGVYRPPGGGGKFFEYFGNLVRGGRLKTLTIDWRGAPERPYHPAADSHVRPGGLRLLEVPNTMVLTRHPLTKAGYSAPWNILFGQPGLEARLHRLMGGGSPAVLSGYFHPTNAYDLLASGAGRRRLFLSAGSRYLGIGLRYLKHHLNAVFAARKRYNFKIKFVTAGELSKLPPTLSVALKRPTTPDNVIRRRPSTTGVVLP